MLWNTALLLLASADYTLATYGRYQAHRHRALNQAKPAVEGVEKMVPWGLAGADTAPNAIPAHEEVQTKFVTLTKTILGQCAPTNTGLTTKILDNIIPQPTLTQHEPGFINPKVIQPKPTEPKPVHSIPPKLDSAHSMPPKPESTKPEPTQPQNTVSIPTHLETQSQMTTDEVTTIHIQMTKTVTVTVIAVAPTAKVSSDVTAPTGTIIASSSSTSESVKARPKPEPTRAKQAPNSLQNLHSLPVHIPGDVDQILPGVGTVIPVPNLSSLDQVLHHGFPADVDWTSIPSTFTSKGFGGQSSPSGSNIHYKGNVGRPWGSNIISVSPEAAHNYKYVAQFNGAKTQPWTVIIWNKVGPDGKMDGWYGHSALTFVIPPGETHYVAFDEDSEGAWGAAPGTHGLPTDAWGGYTSTWGEFSFGDGENSGWSGWDVSAIQAQIAGHDVQGMRICMADGKGCSIITPGAEKVVNAYTESKRHHDGIGGAASPGPVRLVVDLDYRE